MGDKEILSWRVNARKLDQFITPRNLKIYVWPLAVGFLLLVLFLFLGNPATFAILLVLVVFATIHFFILFMAMHIYQEWEYAIDEKGILRQSPGIGSRKISDDGSFTKRVARHHKSAFGRIHMLNPFYLYVPFSLVSDYRTIGNRIILSPKCGILCEFIVIAKNNVDEIIKILDRSIKKEGKSGETKESASKVK